MQSAVRFICATLMVVLCFPSAAQAVTVHTLNEPVEGLERVQFNPALTELIISKEKTVPLDSVVSIDFERNRAGSERKGVELFGRNGDRWMVTLTGIEKRAYQVSSLYFGTEPVKIRQSATLGLMFHDRINSLVNDPTRREEIRVRVREAMQTAPKQDILFVRAGQLKGIILSINNDKVLYKRAGGKKKEEVALTSVLAFYMRPFGKAPKPIDGLYWVASSTDGTIVSGTLTKSDEHQITLQSNLGVSVTIAQASLSTLRVRNGRFTYLSDRPVAQVTYHNYFEEIGKEPHILHHLAFDRNTTGGPITLNGITYPKGLGMHSYTAAEFTIEGDQFRRFRSTIGIDDNAGHDSRSHVEFRVLVDGKPVQTQPIRQDQVATIDIPLPKGAKTITLIADFGEYLAILDRADWAEAMLIK